MPRESHWATRQLGPVLRTKRNQGESSGDQARSQTQSRRGQPQQAYLPSSGYRDRCAHGKQMFSGPECGAGGRELGREEGERGEEPQLGNRMPVDVLLLFSILFIVESFKWEQNGGGQCHNESSALLHSSSPSPTLLFLFYASLQASL